MENYFKRFFIGHLFILIIVVCIGSYIGLSLMSIIIGILLFEFLLYFLDVKYLPKRKTELANKLIEVFNAEPVSEGIMKFKINTIDFFAEAVVDFKLGFQIANVETVRFHIPRHQIDLLSTESRFGLKEDSINGIQTYYVYQTNGLGLKLAKKRFEKMI